MIDERILLEITERIVSATRPSRVILFGSYARGDADAGSDIDLMVIEPDVRNRHEEMVRLRQAVGHVEMGVDLLVYSETEFERSSQVPGTVLYWARKEGPCMKPNVEEALRTLHVASHDMKAPEILKESPEIHLSIVCFHAQQTIEKSLKAVLFLHRIEFRRTHDLTELAQLLRQHGIESPVADLQLNVLNPFAVTFRYDDTLLSQR